MASRTDWKNHYFRSEFNGTDAEGVRAEDEGCKKAKTLAVPQDYKRWNLKKK